MTLSADEFINRLTEIKSDPRMLEIIYEKINKNASTEILSRTQLTQIYTHILNIADLPQILSTLTASSSHRLLKNLSAAVPLPRSCVIMQYPDGHIELIVMPNSKVATGKKIITDSNGSRKKFKVAYRIDNYLDTNLQRARLRVELTQSRFGSHEKILQRLEHEAAISQKLSISPFVCPMFLSSQYQHTKYSQSFTEILQKPHDTGEQFSNAIRPTTTTAIYGFSECGHGNLYALIYSIKQQKTYTPGQQLPEFLIKIITSLLSGLEQIHRAGVLPIDVSLGNVIFIADHDIKFIDFDGAIDLNNNGDRSYRNATFVTASPEVMLMYGLIDGDCYGSQIASAHPNKFKTSVRYELDHYELDHYELDHKDNIWSLGIIILCLLTLDSYQDFNYINLLLEYNPLLKAMLGHTRAERPTAAAALKLWLDNPTFKYFTYYEVSFEKDYALQIQINKEVKNLESTLQTNWLTAIDCLRLCSKVAKDIKNPAILTIIGYRVPSAYSQAAANLQTIYNDCKASLPGHIINLIQNLEIEIDESEFSQHVEPKLKKCLKITCEQHLELFYSVDRNSFIVSLSTHLSALLQDKRNYVTCCGRFLKYNLTDLELNNVINCALSSAKSGNQFITLDKLLTTNQCHSDPLALAKPLLALA